MSHGSMELSVLFPTVKLDSKTRVKGWIDEYPSLIAIAWHGPVYEVALRYKLSV